MAVRVGNFQCTNAFFGTDPDPGTPKYCQIYPGLSFNDGGDYAYRGAEEQSITTGSAGADVLYGEGGAGINWFGNLVMSETPEPPTTGLYGYDTNNVGEWVAKYVPPNTTFSCSNSYFGADPWQGVGKYCYEAVYGGGVSAAGTYQSRNRRREQVLRFGHRGHRSDRAVDKQV